MPDLSVEALLSVPRVVSEERLWLNLYSRLELPSRVLCLTILLLRDPRVDTVPRVDTFVLLAVRSGLLLSETEETEECFLFTLLPA